MAREIETIRERGKGNFKQNAYLNKGSHMVGALAEVIVASQLGLQPDMTDSVDVGHDLTLPDGRTVDVKATTWTNDPHLKVPVSWTKPADVYVLVAVNTDRFLADVVGWATWQEVQGGQVRSYGEGSRYKQNYTLTRNDLHPVADLLTYSLGES